MPEGGPIGPLQEVGRFGGSEIRTVALSHLAEEYLGFPGGSDSKESTCNVGDPGSIPGSGKQPTPVFLPGEFQGQRSLAGYSPQGHKESDMTERLNIHTHAHTS